MSASSLNFPSQFSVGAEDVIMRDEPVQTSVPTLEVASPVPTRGKRSITEEHWKWLQPIVSHFYIEENLTFHQIQTKLKLDYDFYLSPPWVASLMVQQKTYFHQENRQMGTQKEH
ncbi:hypothetical protein ACMFMF_007543 [Clarireedia jacksonii]